MELSHAPGEQEASLAEGTCQHLSGEFLVEILIKIKDHTDIRSAVEGSKRYWRLRGGLWSGLVKPDLS